MDEVVKLDKGNGEVVFLLLKRSKNSETQQNSFFMIIDLHKHKFCQAFYHTLANTIKSL